jgi:ankyrin repeat protein
MTPIILAAFAGRTEMVRLLINKKANLDARDLMGRTALMFAAGEHPDIVSDLIHAGCDVNVKDNEGRTALMYTADPKIQDLIKIAGGTFGKYIDPMGPENLRKRYEMPLVIAAAMGSSAEVKRLLAAGENVNEENSNKDTALTVALIFRRRYVVPLLIAGGANVNLPGARGETPLMYAATDADGSVYELLKAGATANVKDANGLTALDYAKQAGAPKQIVDMLQSALQTTGTAGASGLK